MVETKGVHIVREWRTNLLPPERIEQGGGSAKEREVNEGKERKEETNSWYWITRKGAEKQKRRVP